MILSDLSVRRPVLASVMSLLIVVAGAAAFSSLPVREYPDVDRPLVSVSTIYLGASPETIEAAVTEPLEQALNGIEGIRSIDSSSAFGVSSINVEFSADRDVDIAAMDVSNAIQRAIGRLPESAERPVVRKAGANSRPIIWINVAGDGYSPVDLTDIADRYVKTPLQLLPGVARAVIGGERRYAMRVWLDPARMAAHHVDALDVRRAIEESNLQLPAGEIEAHSRKYIINADARIHDAEGFGRIVIREEEGVPVRINDVAELELGSESYQVVARYTAKDVVGVGIVRQSTSNELAVSEAVHAALPEINRSLPEGVEVSLAVDFTIFVREAIRQVSFTLMIAFAAVVLVNLLFLHSPTTTAITTVAIPTSLIGTFAVLEVLGFSINILTLLALVLSIGLLVDDAIVVTENIFRRQEQGESRREAALLGAREVGFPVIATTVAVVAVLIPLSLMSGDIGRLFREFALTMAICVTISTFVALTAVPMFCSRFLDVTRQPGIVGAAVDRRMDSMRHGYGRILGLALHHRGIVGALFLMLLVLTGLLYRGLDQTFLPVEDRGRIFVLIRAPQGSTTAYTQRALTQVEEKLLATPEIAGFFAAIGMGFGTPASSSLGMVFIRMQHWDDRERKQQEVVAELFPAFMDIPEAHVYAINPPSLSRRSNRDVEVVIKSSSAELEKMREITEAIVGRMQELPGLVNVESDLRLENPQLDIVFDREHGADVGVPVRAVSESLRLLLSQGPADDFILRNKQYNVVMALASPFRSVPEQLGEVHVRGREGVMLPLSSLIVARPRIGPAKLNHYDLQRSATISANLAQDAALGSALSQVEAIFDELLPAGFTRSLRGTSREFVESANEVFFTFGLALLVIYLVLAAQFESFVHPLTILVTVPLASLGALSALHISHNTLNLYSQIGIILLVGLVTKNGILIVDFANRARARGASLERSLLDAGRIRFRPILMTSVTSIMGALPLALAGGAGAESRQALGVAVVGGLIVATIFTLVVVPVAHYVLVRGTEALGWSAPPRTLEGA